MYICVLECIFIVDTVDLASLGPPPASQLFFRAFCYVLLFCLFVCLFVCCFSFVSSLLLPCFVLLLVSFFGCGIFRACPKLFFWTIAFYCGDRDRDDWSSHLALQLSGRLLLLRWSRWTVLAFAADLHALAICLTLMFANTLEEKSLGEMEFVQ